jgi:hypothetical protein
MGHPDVRYLIDSNIWLYVEDFRSIEALEVIDPFAGRPQMPPKNR